MDESPAVWSIALDGGTTNTRARLIHGDRIVATARRPVGVRDAVIDPGSRPLAVAVRSAIEEVSRGLGDVRPDLIIAAGMLSSEVGLTAVPHAEAPAGIDALARGVAVHQLPEIVDRPIHFVPGVRTSPAPGDDGWAEADVMRGEECETMGAWTHLAARSPQTTSRDASGPAAVFLWPGSHTKLVAVDARGWILRSHTTLAGEMTAALARHTLIASSLPRDLPDEPDRAALDAGARLVTREGLGRAAFLVRIAALAEALGPEERAAFWLGAVVADDVAHLARHRMLDGPIPVRVGGRQPLRSLYARWLGERHAGPVTALEEELAEHASAFGALAIARRRVELSGSHDSPQTRVKPR